MKLAQIFLSVFVLIALSACASSQYAGKVIPGSVGRPITVDANDDRINSTDGMAGLTVTLYNEKQQGRPALQIAQTMTDDEGHFRFKIKSSDTPRGAVVIRVAGEGIYSARAKTYLPRDDQFMLFSVVTREPTLDQPAFDPEK